MAIEEKEELLLLLQEDIDASLQTVSVSKSDAFSLIDPQGFASSATLDSISEEDEEDWDESSDVENARVTTRLPDILKSQFSPDIHVEFSTDFDEVQSLHNDTTV